MKKGTNHFKETIQAKLREIVNDDPVFDEKLKKENKDIDGCINFIIHQVKEIGAQGYTDDEIFGLAIHYYDEDDIKNCDPIDCGVVIDHKPKLSKEEKKELREQVQKEEMDKERKRLHSKKSKATRKKNANDQASLF